MKKNKRNSRIFSCVLAYLSWATAHSLRGEHATAYREVTAAKRLIADFGGEDVKLMFYDREWHIQFTLYRDEYAFNCYYSVSASHGYVNDYHITNKSNVNTRIATTEFVRDCTLCRDFHNYQLFRQYGDSILFWILTRDEYADYWCNGEIYDIPYDITLRLWQDLRECAERVVYEAIAHKKVVL